MRAPETGRPDALGPTRAELLRAARADAAALIARAREEAGRTVRDAGAEAASIGDHARRQGTEEGTAAHTSEVRRARRAASAARLATQGEIYAELARMVTGRVRELYEAEPTVDDLLRARARALLGPEARTSDHPDGGIRAVVPGREVDLGVPALAARALESCGPEVEALWEP